MDKKQHYKIWSIIRDKRIFEAISLLKSEITAIGNSRMADALANVENTYSYMIDFMLGGNPDSSRADILNDIINRLHSINDSVLRESLKPAGSSSYYSALRMTDFSGSRLRPLLDSYFDAYATASLAALAGSDDKEVFKRKEECLNSLFDYTFSISDSSDEFDQLSDAVTSPSAPYELQAQIVSALTLGLNFFYSKKALNTLIDIYEKKINDKIAVRALTGIVLTLALYPYRVSIDKKTTDRLSLWKDSIITYRQLREVVRNIVFTRDTDRVADKMKNEVIPEIMKLKPGFMQKLRDSGLDAEGFPSDNPEWEEILEKNGVADRLREISDLQAEGADVMMTAFSQLKSFPFFNRLSNWFLPFDCNHTELKLSEETHRGALETLLSIEGMICDSDRYSLALAMSRMPESQKNMMLSQVEANAEQLSEAVKEMKSKSSMPEFDIELLRYIRDLFRFFRLFRDKGSFRDPFSKPFDFVDLPVIGEMMKDPEVLHIASEFYFKRGFYKDALEILKALKDEDSSDSYYWEKRGYCNHALKNFDEALECYKKAELLKKPSRWLTEKLAVLNRRLGNYSESAEYYASLLESDPDNVKLLFSLGDVLLSDNRLDDALRNFYHAEYLSPDSARIKRAVAWAEMLKGNIEKSRKYFSSLTENSKEPSDFINLGHLALLSNEVGYAENMYLKAIELHDDKSAASFRESFMADYKLLSGFGVDDATISILLDDITRKINS